jgi:hypothetical protein
MIALGSSSLAMFTNCLQRLLLSDDTRCRYNETRLPVMRSYAHKYRSLAWEWIAAFHQITQIHVLSDSIAVIHVCSDSVMLSIRRDR